MNGVFNAPFMATGKETGLTSRNEINLIQKDKTHESSIKLRHDREKERMVRF